jgi:phosphatidate phosphatase APP1
VLVPEAGAQFGIISDMDDTVVQTDVTRWARVLGAVLFGNAHTRLPFRGVAAFYRALEVGTGGARNPLFYVSSSPWNLYDLLLEFLTLGQIPLGPLNLRAWRGGAGELFPSEHGAFKQGEIRRILDTYRELSFILIGDRVRKTPRSTGRS